MENHKIPNKRGPETILGDGNPEVGSQITNETHRSSPRSSLEEVGHQVRRHIRVKRLPKGEERRWMCVRGAGKRRKLVYNLRYMLT